MPSKPAGRYVLPHVGGLALASAVSPRSYAHEARVSPRTRESSVNHGNEPVRLHVNSPLLWVQAVRLERAGLAEALDLVNNLVAAVVARSGESLGVLTRVRCDTRAKALAEQASSDWSFVVHGNDRHFGDVIGKFTEQLLGTSAPATRRLRSVNQTFLPFPPGLSWSNCRSSFAKEQARLLVYWERGHIFVFTSSIAVEETTSQDIYSCRTLFVSAEPKQSITALDVKFSLAISSRLDHWRVCLLRT